MPISLANFEQYTYIGCIYIQDGKMKMPIDNVYPLEEAREALRVIEDREVIGKVIVQP